MASFFWPNRLQIQAYHLLPIFSPWVVTNPKSKIQTLTCWASSWALSLSLACLIAASSASVSPLSAGGAWMSVSETAEAAAAAALARASCGCDARVISFTIWVLAQILYYIMCCNIFLIFLIFMTLILISTILVFMIWFL